MARRIVAVWFLSGALFGMAAWQAVPASTAATIIVPPPAGKLYHGVFPGGSTGAEDDITNADIAGYETSVAHRVAWVYLSNNWYASRKFPWAKARMIRNRGSVPYIRLMLRSSPDNPRPEPLYTLDRILRGRFDYYLKRWAYSARSFGTPLIVEYGTEMNGEWFSWNGKWNGAGRLTGFGSPTKYDGPERFVRAYRHIVSVMRGMGARNIIWIFHVNWDAVPYERWNRYAYYYPGDGYIDWLAISAYGAQSRYETRIDTFRTEMDYVYPRLAAVSATKPMIVAEFGTDVRNPRMNAATWTRDAIDDMASARWRRVVGFSWWNERWQNDASAANDTTMRVQDSAALSTVFQTELDAHADKVVLRPIYGTR